MSPGISARTDEPQALSFEMYREPVTGQCRLGWLLEGPTCLLALGREHQRGHLSARFSFKPMSFAAFLSTFHSCSTYEGFFQICHYRNKSCFHHHVRVISNGNRHCCAVQEPAHFRRNGHVGLLLKYESQLCSVGRPATPRLGHSTRTCRQQPV